MKTFLFLVFWDTLAVAGVAALAYGYYLIAG